MQAMNTNAIERTTSAVQPARRHADVVRLMLLVCGLPMVGSLVLLTLLPGILLLSVLVVGQFPWIWILRQLSPSVSDALQGSPSLSRSV